jgi:hypothetical protein
MFHEIFLRRMLMAATSCYWVLSVWTRARVVKLFAEKRQPLAGV